MRYKYIILTEGYFDVIAMTRQGFDNVVATMGTNLSDYHARMLQRLKVPIYLCFDQDIAGFKANLHSAEILIKHQISVKVISWFFNSIKDPDELINKKPNLKISDLIAKAKHPLFYILEYFKNQKSLNYDVIMEIALFAKPILANIHDKVLKELFFQKLSQLSGISIHNLHNTFGVRQTTTQNSVFEEQSIIGSDESFLATIKRYEIHTSEYVI